MSEKTYYVNANVVTVDQGFTVATQFAVSGGRFSAVGHDLLPEDRSADMVVDLQGRTVLPGFVDSHAHVPLRAIEDLADPDLRGLMSVSEICAAIKEVAGRRELGSWIVTSPIGVGPDYFGLPEGLLERRWPTRHELDAVAPDNPVYIPTPVPWPNPAILNSRALAELGLRDDAQDPDGVRLERDESGSLTGLVHGLNFYNKTPLMASLQAITPVPSAADLAAVTLKALDENLAAGVTAIYECHLNAFMPVFQSLKDAGKLRSRVLGTLEVPVSSTLPEIEAWFMDRPEAFGEGEGDDRLRVKGVTASLDGAIQFGKAFMETPYLDPDGLLGNGSSALSLEEVIEICHLALRTNTRLHLLAAGSAALKIVMEALIRVDKEVPLTDRGWMVLHVQHPTKQDIAELARMGLSAQSYSSVDYSKGAIVYRERLAGDLWESAVPLRWWLDGGVVIAQGSDGAHYNPLFQIWESLARVDGRTGESLMAPPKEISREEAIQLYTINGARVMQMSDRIGSIEPGKYADFVVLDRDLLTCTVPEILQSKVLATCVEGEPVYDPAGLLETDDRHLEG